MERNIKIKCITLKKLKVGESNAGVTLLTEDNRVLFVMAFGAMKPKSKLFSGTAPFTLATWDLYYDPVKDYYRGKEVDVINQFTGVQNSIEGFYTGSLFLEIILKSQGADGVFPLLKDAISLLNSGYHNRKVLIQFILRLLDDQGILPSFSYCSQCGKKDGENLYYNELSNDFELLCPTCNTSRKVIVLNPGILAFCNRTLQLDIESTMNIGLNRESEDILKNFLIELIKKFTEGKLLTLNSCNGLI